jgi:hypothetical protein
MIKDKKDDISSFLKKYPYINEDYYNNLLIKYPDLSFKEIIPLYLEYIKDIDNEEPDTEQSLERMTRQLVFVYMFCREHGINMSDYEYYSIGTIPEWVNHLKKRKISFYTLQCLTFQSPMLDSSLIEFTIPNFFKLFFRTRNKFLHSKKMKQLSRKILEKLKNKLTETTNN